MDWVAIPIAALIGGGLGGLFSRGLIVASREAGRLADGSHLRRAAIAGAFGLLVALLAVLTASFAAGTGYAETRHVLETGEALPWFYGPAKLVSTLLSAAAGIPGGLFSPSLSVGAALGSTLAALLPGSDPATVATLVMAAYFAGVVQSPLTASIIVLEMTASGRTPVPLLATTLLAAGLSRLVSREPVYHALALAYANPRRFAAAEGPPSQPTR
jgi:H+/Cl- antiporter ClcA